jgi:hypothetical protein
LYAVDHPGGVMTCYEEASVIGKADDLNWFYI